MKTNFKVFKVITLLLILILPLPFIYSCTSNRSQITLEERYSPGTALIIASVNNIKPDGVNIIVELTPFKIIGYGAASSPIPANTKLSALAIADRVKDLLTKYNSEDSLIVELKLSQSGVNKQNSIKWEILSILKNK